MIKGIRLIEKLDNFPLNKDKAFKKTKNMKLLFEKSIVASDNLPKNHIIKIKDINFKKPGTGVPASELDKILGKKLKKKYKKNEFFVLKDLI